MNLFGLQFAPSFPFVTRAGQNDLPTVPNRQQVPSGGDLTAREVPGNVLTDWWLTLPDMLTPAQVSQILRASLAGNLWQFSQLVNRMQDSWPTFRKCAMELRQAVKMVNFKVDPYAEEGKDPTPEALEKSRFVHRCLSSFQPDRFTDEDAFKGMIFDLTDAVLIGVSIVELLWTDGATDPEGHPENRIRASAWVHPKHYGVTENGGIGVEDMSRGDPLAFNFQFAKGIRNNPSKYLVARYKSKSGSPLGAGEARCLAICWVNIMFAVDWIRNGGQKFGTPFIAIPYTPGIPESERIKFEMAAKRAASLGYMVYPRSTPDQKPEFYDAKNVNSDNPIRIMVDLAEKWCVQLLLWQTLTSDTGDGGEGGGAFALGKVHSGVRQEKLEGIADWIAEIIERQLAVSLLQENYGNADECPHVKADFTHVETPMEATQRITMATNARIPLLADETYVAIGMTQPQEGDHVIYNGEIKVQGKPLSDEEKFAQQMDQQVQQAEAQMALQAEAQGESQGDQPTEEESEPEEQSLAASERPVRDVVRNVLEKATDDQFGELEALVIKAKDAGTGNGQWQAVQVKLAEINGGRVNLFEEVNTE